MKKLLLSLLAITLSTGLLSAQDRFAVGLKGGITSSKIKFTDLNISNLSVAEVNSKAKIGYHFGAFGRVGLVGGLAFQPEVYYAMKKSKITVDNLPVDIDDKYKNIGGEVSLYTVDVPLLAHLRIIDMESAQVYGLAGPVLSFVSKHETALFDENVWNTKTYNPDQTNWTLQVGAGIDFWKLTLDARYEWGLKDISTEKIGNKTDVFTVAVGFKVFSL